MTQSILMVCLGNICRSPLAEGIMRHLIQQKGLEDKLSVDSCGTGSWHVGEPTHREDFDWLVAMDSSNLSGIQRLDPSNLKADTTVLLLDFAGPSTPKDVPDPYYEGGFDGVYDVIYEGCEGLLAHIEEQM